MDMLPMMNALSPKLQNARCNLLLYGDPIFSICAEQAQEKTRGYKNSDFMLCSGRYASRINL
jgi:hypothetical protein